MKKINIILLVLISMVAGVVFTSLFVADVMAEASIYTNFTDPLAKTQKVHIVGEWVIQDDAPYDATYDLFQFWMKDSLNNTMRVRYHDPKPPNFESAEKVVVIGQCEEDYFVADKILMKCPSKYNETEIAVDDSQYGTHPED